MTTQNTIPVLLDKRPKGVVLSPSQIGTWDLCQRRWAFEYILGIRSPPHPSAELGTKVHTKLERWLTYATPPSADDNSEMEDKAAKIAARMIKNLPPPGTGAVERRFWFRTQHGHFYNGFIDWSGVIESMPTVIDHKTSSNVKAYGKTEADLHNDVQAVIYSVAGFLGFETDVLDLFWNYGETKGKFNTTPIKTRVSLSVVANKFEDVIEPVAAEIVWHRNNKTDPMSFSPTVSACSAYGGCPHKSRCNLTSQQLLGGIMEQQGQSMAERMAAATAPVQPGNGAGLPQQPQFQQPQFQQPQQPQQPQQQILPVGPPMAMQPPQVAPPQVAPPQVAPPTTEGAPPPQPYAPTVAPNPPESGIAPAAESADTGADTKRGKGRPAGSRNKTLTVEQQVFLAGVSAAISNPAWDGSPASATHGGEAALHTFNEKFK